MKLVAREFWLSGRLVNDLTAVFIGDDRGAAWKVFLDDEDYTWKAEPEADVPSVQPDERDPDFQWPVKDLLDRFPVAGDTINRFEEANIGSRARATLRLASGRALIFEYEYATERSTLELEVPG